MSPFCGATVSCFRLLVTSPLGFKARVGIVGVHITRSLIFTPSDLLVASMATELSRPRTCEALVRLEGVSL